MPVMPDQELRKVTLNLYEEDCRLLERFYGHGWSVEARQAVHRFALGLNYYLSKNPKTVEDLVREQGT